MLVGVTEDNSLSIPRQTSLARDPMTALHLTTTVTVDQPKRECYTEKRDLFESDTPLHPSDWPPVCSERVSGSAHRARDRAR